MFSLTGLMRASSGSIALMPSILSPVDTPLWSSRTSARLRRCGAIGDCGLARLRHVDEAVKDCSPRLVKAGPSVFLRAKFGAAQLRPSPLLHASSPASAGAARQSNVFGASVAKTGKETRIPVASTNHYIRTVSPSTHNSSRQVEERCLLCRLRRLELTDVDGEYGRARSRFNDPQGMYMRKQRRRRRLLCHCSVISRRVARVAK